MGENSHIFLALQECWPRATIQWPLIEIGCLVLFITTIESNGDIS